MSSAGIELKDIQVSKKDESSMPNPSGGKDQRSFRPDSMAEMNAGECKWPTSTGRAFLNCSRDKKDLSCFIALYIILLNKPHPTHQLKRNDERRKETLDRTVL